MEKNRVSGYKVRNYGDVDDHFERFIYPEGRKNFEVFYREDGDFTLKTSFSTKEGLKWKKM